MAFCKFSSDYIKDGFVPVDNIFMLSFLPSADATDTKVYLYGLTLVYHGDENENSLEKIALALKLSEERVLSAYKYWENQGLINISTTFPTRITYNSVKNPTPPIVKYNTREYATFVEELTRLFPEKVLMPNEQTEYIDLIRVFKMEINAMLMIIKYCNDLKAGNASTAYVLAVANDWIKQGLTTEEKVNCHIANLEANSEAIRMILKAIGVKTQADLDDRQLYLKWINEYRYSLDAILVAAKAQKKRGGMAKLDKYIEELRNASAYTVEEIANYTKNKENIYNLAINVVKNMGGYYASMDIVIETYVNPWLARGFTENALLTIARFCFLKNVRNLEGMEQMVSRFFKLGLLDEAGINGYIEKQIAIDEKIMAVFEKCNYIGIITNRDRESYRTWINWGYDDEIIHYIASLANNNPFPIQSINRNIANLHQNGIKTLAEAKEHLSGNNKKEDFSHHNYSEDQLKKVLVDFNTWEL